MVNCGDTFLTGDGDEGNFHLWIVVTPPKQREVVTTCLVTARKKTERLVVLQPGDHPFIKHESVISYLFSRIRLVDDIDDLLVRGFARRKEPVTPEVLRRIQAGLLESDFTPNGVRAYFRETML